MPTDLYLAGAAAWLPPAVSAKQVAANGGYSEEELTANGIVCAPEGTDSPPEMAARAAATALSRSPGVTSEDIALVLHAHSHHQGQAFWSPASYVAREIGVTGAVAVNIGQMSNSGMAALELALPYLAARPGAAALVTAADRFRAPSFDRWSADLGIVYGDGAAALVVSGGGGFAKVLSMRTRTDPSLERLHRGNVPFTDHAGAEPVNVRRTKVEYVTEVGLPSIIERSTAGVMSVVSGALADAGLGMDQMAVVVLPNLGRHVLAAQYLQHLELTPERTLMDWTAHTGHLGGGDQLAAVARLVETKRVSAGQHVLLVGAGGGFSWSAAVVEVLEVPDWPEQTAMPELPADV
ncbi:hypothetical protein BU204_32275 [Actinophytocola xanthii]|uniref:Beta-ketoacyl-[acyl-carrier-protein] synthase III C-terminal domain-containing protein n=1 Tax=Actinophytocola xanthii TaxID=1912961 RepID=A0A1Q8C6K7_9PSEU|nr:hypothetical protein BU204_32275 [Actinophytocola xanthii]